MNIVEEIAEFLRIAFDKGFMAAVYNDDPEAFNSLETQFLAMFSEDFAVEAVDSVLPDHVKADAIQVAAQMMFASLDRKDTRKLAEELAIERLKDSRPLPPYLAKIAVEKIEGKTAVKKSGPKPRTNRIRDSVIALTVLRLTTRGYRKTKNRESSNQSACSIVAEAYSSLGGGSLTTEAVEKIVDRRSKQSKQSTNTGFPWADFGPSE